MQTLPRGESVQLGQQRSCRPFKPPGCIPRLRWPGSDVRRNEPRLWGRALAGTVRSKLLSGESYLVAVAPPTTAAAAPATTISSVAAASSATAAAGTFRLRARLIDVDRASAD
jgi:hypothetical protein